MLYAKLFKALYIYNKLLQIVIFTYRQTLEHMFRYQFLGFRLLVSGIY